MQGVVLARREAGGSASLPWREAGGWVPSRDTVFADSHVPFWCLSHVNVQSIQKLNLKMLTFKNSLLESVKGNNTQPIPTLQVESQLDFGTTACPTESPEHSVISATYSFPSPSKNFLWLLWLLSFLAGVSNILASLVHTGRRFVLGHTLKALQHVITKQSHNVLTKLQFSVESHS